MSAEEESLIKERIAAGVCLDCGVAGKEVAHVFLYRGVGEVITCKDCLVSPEERARREKRDRAREVRRAAVSSHTYELPSRDRLGHHDLTEETYQRLFEEQQGLCAVCGEFSEKRLHIDHDHTCNPLIACAKCVRGLLCSGCNTGLGFFQDNPARLRAAADYLEGHTVC